MAKFLSKPAGVSYFLPSAKPRFKPRVAPKIGLYGIEKPRIAPRILPAGTPKPSLSGVSALKMPKLASKPAGATQLSSLTKGAHKGRPVALNPKPKTPSQLTGIKTKPRTTARLPSSVSAQRPGIHSMQSMKKSTRRANPLKLSHLSV